MGVNNFKVGDKVQYKFGKSFVGRVASILGEGYLGIVWESYPDLYVVPLPTEKTPYHSRMYYDDLNLIKRSQVEYPEDGTWV